MSSAPSRFIWFLLLDSATGQSYKGTSADKVSVFSSADVADFRDAVKKKDKDDGDAAVLTPFKSSQLFVYKNKAAFDKRYSQYGKETPLMEDSLVDGLGQTKEEALIVVVPSSRSSIRGIYESSLTVKEPTDNLQSLQDAGKNGVAPLIARTTADFDIKLEEIRQEIKQLENSEEYKTLAGKNSAWATNKPTEQEKGEWYLLNKKLDELRGERQDYVKIILSIHSRSVKKFGKSWKEKHDMAINDERLFLSTIARKIWEKFQFDCEFDDLPRFEDLKRAAGFNYKEHVRDYFRKRAIGQVEKDDLKESITKEQWIWLIGLDQRVNQLLHDTLITNEDGSLRLVLEHDIYKESAEVAKNLVQMLYGPEKKVNVIAAESD